MRKSLIRFLRIVASIGGVSSVQASIQAETLLPLKSFYRKALGYEALSNEFNTKTYQIMEHMEQLQPYPYYAQLVNHLSAEMAFEQYDQSIIEKWEAQFSLVHKQYENMWEKLAEEGHIQAQIFLALTLRMKGNEQDAKKSILWMTKAAEQGDVTAQFNLGVIYINGEQVLVDETQSIKWFLRAAEQGNVFAQHKVAAMYDNGRGIKEDKVEAFKWYRKAAKQEYPRSQLMLGLFYMSDYGNITRNEKKAVKWISKAAHQGDETAQILLGKMYEVGELVQQDKGQATEWYQKVAGKSLEDASKYFERCASGIKVMHYEYNNYFIKHLLYKDEWRVLAETGNAQAIFITSLHFLLRGHMGKCGFENINHTQTQAAKQGSARAQFNLGWIYEKFSNKDKAQEKAIKWYRKAAEQGHIAAQFALGKIYLKSKYLDENEIHAVEWLCKAADQGFPPAQMMLGILYMKGIAVAQDGNKGIEWIYKAAHQGDVLAQTFLGEIYEKGEGVILDKSQATEWYLKASKQGYQGSGKI